MTTLRWPHHGYRPTPSDRLYRTKDPTSPILFFVMLAIIIGSILMFVILRPSGHTTLLPLLTGPMVLNV